MDENTANLIKMRDLLRKAADSIDEIIALDERSEAGEDVVEEMETASAKFVLNLMKLQTLNQKL